MRRSSFSCVSRCTWVKRSCSFSIRIFSRSLRSASLCCRSLAALSSTAALRADLMAISFRWSQKRYRAHSKDLGMPSISRSTSVLKNRRRGYVIASTLLSGSAVSSGSRSSMLRSDVLRTMSWCTVRRSSSSSSSLSSNSTSLPSASTSSASSASASSTTSCCCCCCCSPSFPTSGTFSSSICACSGPRRPSSSCSSPPSIFFSSGSFFRTGGDISC
mmetsp:Transcript_27480/g.37672  ORF Transcript_27480/g.37672 Transcript_27480/m.37672 type:complete len:217 (-) Transcript_27480:174-824(-)